LIRSPSKDSAFDGYVKIGTFEVVNQLLLAVYFW